MEISLSNSQNINLLTDTIDEFKIQCVRCGGNGHLKTSPNRYKTCLSCYGKGHIIEKK